MTRLIVRTLFPFFGLLAGLSSNGWSVPAPGGDKKDRIAARVELVFTSRDEQIIHRYFDSNPGNLPPGLAKRGGNLPPGLEKHLERSGTLPPGLQKRVQPFPVELDRQLPRLPGGYARALLEGRAVILGPHNTIIDVLVLHGGRHREHEYKHHEHERENEHGDRDDD